MSLSRRLVTSSGDLVTGLGEGVLVVFWGRHTYKG